MSTPDASSTTRRQKRMGPAPFASFEDLSDEVRTRLESPTDEKAGHVVRLPGIREDATPSSPSVMNPELQFTGISLVGQIKTPVEPSTSFSTTPASGVSKLTPATPRIDISRASSSSHHDSKDSSPDRAVPEKERDDPMAAKLGIGYREDGTLDLRSSTEELAFQDPHERKQRIKSRPQSPLLGHTDHDPCNNFQRKDSQCSEIGLLCISGRTSRLSSVGSQGSAYSGRLSVLSGQTDVSRSPSPHKMLMETSFCGTRSPRSSLANAIEETIGIKPEQEDLEKLLLARKHDPREAILAEGTVKPSLPPEKPIRKTSPQVIKSDITIKVDKPEKTIEERRPSSSKIVAKSGVEYIYIPLKGPLPLDLQKPKSKTVVQIGSSRISTIQSTTLNLHKNSSPSSSKVLTPVLKTKTSPHADITKKIEAKSTTLQKHSTVATIESVPKKRTEPKYIRIKLKPDHMYDSDENSTPTEKYNTTKKMEKIDFDEIKTDDSATGTSLDTGKSIWSTPSTSPKFSRHTISRDFIDSKTPSPSLSRKSSFASIFRSKEAITSPESPTVPKRKGTLGGILKDASESLREKRSRSKSRERDHPLTSSNAPSSTESIESKSKQKTMFSIFKSPKSDNNKKVEIRKSPEILPENITKVEFKFEDNYKKPNKFEKPLEGNSVRIPLHSPTYYENPKLLRDIQTPSQDSQDTVIEVPQNRTEENKDVKKSEEQNINEESIQNAPLETNLITNQQKSSFNEDIIPDKSTNNTDECQRQSSTSSENLVFSTKVNDEIFTTKLPKTKCITGDKSETNILNGHIPRLEETAQKIIVEKLTIISEKDKNISESNENISSVDVEENTILPKSETSKSSLADDEKNSSESERGSVSSIPQHIKRSETIKEKEVDPLDIEKKELVVSNLNDSFEDELPYVPTTLPMEKSAAVPIIPVKQRSSIDMKTCPIERPRSTTPINPSNLDDYVEEVVGVRDNEALAKNIEKLRISLPRFDSLEKSVKSPRVVNTTWFEFAEKGLIKTSRKPSTSEGDTPPPLPPKGIQKEWINFEDVPERRKPPKRIQTIPSRSHIDVPEGLIQDQIVYNYVNPEECKCECHELKAKEKLKESEVSEETKAQDIQDDELPLLENEPGEEDKSLSISLDRSKIETHVVVDRQSLISDSSMDLSMGNSMDQPEAINLNGILETPFKTDLSVSSNRSSIVSQDPSPESESPNAFSKP